MALVVLKAPPIRNEVIFQSWLWLIMQIESMLSREFEYIYNTVEVASIQQYIEDLRKERPIVRWKVECYHYETEYETVYHDTEEEVANKVNKISHTETQVLPSS